MDTTTEPNPTPTRDAANRATHPVGGGRTDTVGERLRQAALASRARGCSTGPRTAAGEARSDGNGRAAGESPAVVRALRAELAWLAAEMARTRRHRDPRDGVETSAALDVGP